MGNLWLCWGMEFFVEMFDLMRQGLETKPAASEAHKKTLYKHQSIFQRSAFTAAIAKLPVRTELLAKLGGGVVYAATVDAEISLFVDVLRPIVRFMWTMNLEADMKVQEARKAYATK